MAEPIDALDEARRRKTWSRARPVPGDIEFEDEERYALTIAEGHEAVRLRDQKSAETREFEGPRALYDALGVLADWRERDGQNDTEVS